MCVFGAGSLLCCVGLGALFDLAIVLLIKRELAALVRLWHCYRCLVSLPHGAADWSVDRVIVTFLGQNHLLVLCRRATCKS